MSKVGFPEPRKVCSTGDAGATSDAAVSGGDGPSADRPVLTSFEGHYCSMSPEESPQSRCSTQFDLLCIGTYSERVLGSGDAGSRDVRIDLCRLRCVPGGAACPDRNDVCCSGQTAGGGTGYACVPAGRCSFLDGGAGN
jgi:hypothetical protein